MPGVRLGVDVGAARIGVARCDAEQIMSVPVETVPAGGTAAARIAEIAHECGATVVYVGLPVSLGGHDTPSTLAAVSFARDVADLAPSLDVRLVDERLSTRTASSHLRAAGRSSRASKHVVDQAAAMVILDQALAVEQASRAPAGIAAGDHR